MYSYGFNPDNCIMCDTRGVIYKGRAKGMNPYKEHFQVADTGKVTLEDAFKNTDIAIGLSEAGQFTPDMIKSMNKDPILFCLANPEPEMRPEAIYEVRDDAIIATGRSDYPN